MANPIVQIRMSPAQRAAAERKAAEVMMELSAWLRSLVERETGVSGELPRGLAAVSKRRRQQAQRASVRARIANQPEQVE